MLKKNNPTTFFWQYAKSVAGAKGEKEGEEEGRIDIHDKQSVRGDKGDGKVIEAKKIGKQNKNIYMTKNHSFSNL